MDMKTLSNGTKVKATKSGKEFIVDAVLHTGTGQGDIYRVHSDDGVFAMKLFHTGSNPMIMKQMKRLLRRGQACDSIVHPLHIVDVDGKIGYIMEYVDDSKYSDAYILFNGYESDADGNRYELPFNEKLNILYNIADAMEKLYNADIALMDLKFDNIKVHKDDFSIKLIDTDSAVQSGKKGMVRGTIGFMPPLTMRNEETPTKYNDTYALAVMIFMSLIGGHPLRGKMEDSKACGGDSETYMFATNPIYIFNKLDKNNECIDRRISERMAKYPKYFKDAMEKCFVDGLYEKEKRLTPTEWKQIILQLYDDHFLCLHCGEEQFFDSDATTCDNCGRALKRPISMVCNEVDGSETYLFNNLVITARDFFHENVNGNIFKVIVNPFDKCFMLKNLSKYEVEMTLANKETKVIHRDENIPIFMDTILKVGKYTIKFKGGKR